MAEMWISMGPQHPMTHGLWTLKVKVDGETVVDTEPDLGYIHRGVEKICEARDFTQITTYCDRLCYASANTWSHSYIYAVEDLLEVEVPERAEYIRLIAVEPKDISSSGVRDQIGEGASIYDSLSASVRSYIDDHHLVWESHKN